ncbi:hypothetical protein CYB_2240 [Synechococcus sp. JA-2-3B'a(2-13)]|nr:hypothetical protein CYB_2240 [Synechococcus sp. JA-2-3B'a(2-13)]
MAAKVDLFGEGATVPSDFLAADPVEDLGRLILGSFQL